MTEWSHGSVVMRHATGVHARPTVKLAKLAKGFVASIDLGLSAEGPWVDAKSVTKVMGTRAPKDSIIHFRARGSDAVAAVKALVTLVEADFGDGA